MRMLSSEGKPTEIAVNGKQVLSSTQGQSEQGLDREQVFRLIESTLSFEACLYHQILPFKIEDNNLLLGMVNPQDSAALDYVNRILPYINCTMEIKLITGDFHRTILSAYLNHKNTAVSTGKPMPKSWEDIAQAKNPATLTDQPTTATSNQFESVNQQPSTPTMAGVKSAPEETILQVAYSPFSDSQSTLETTQHTNPDVPTLHNQVTQESPQGISNTNSLHILHLTTPETLTTIEELQALPPKKLLEQLLARVLAGGIGRLYLERQPYHGRILWSENGVLQSVLEKVSLSVFQGVLNELKRFASLPVATLVEPKQIEKECLYQNNRLLLRWRVMPGMYGEEATLQVLRGAALKFYQQQQLTRLSRDAIGISQQLTYKLHELKERLALNYNLNSGQLEAFMALNRLLKNLDTQIRVLTDISEVPKQDK